METAAQSEIVALLKGHANPLLLLGDEHAVRVRSLVLVPNLVGYGFAPNPHLRSYFARLKQLLRIEVPRNRRIYVTRRDSGNRVLKNEADVMDLVDGYGFQSVELTGLSLRDQALLFASASHLVSPHGAGLANLMFCDEGTFLCELQMHSYLHPCFRRLAAILRVRYGCVIGYPDPRADAQSWVHEQQWTVPLDRLEAALRQMTRSLVLSTVSTRRAMHSQDLVGNLEPTQTDLIGGWVFHRDRPGVVLELRIHIDGRWIATVPTSRSRPDVEAVFPGGRNAGFEFAIPPYLRDGKLHLVNVTVAGSDLVLPGCPFIHEYSHPTPQTYPHFSLNGESPICSDIGGFAETSPATDEVPHPHYGWTSSTPSSRSIQFAAVAANSNHSCHMSYRSRGVTPIRRMERCSAAMATSGRAAAIFGILIRSLRTRRLSVAGPLVFLPMARLLSSRHPCETTIFIGTWIAWQACDTSPGTLT